MKKTFVILTALTMFAFAQQPSFAMHTGETIHVKVLGMVCDFCAQSVKKVFMDTGAVESVDINLDDALVTIQTKPEQAMDDETITTYIKTSGYNIESIHHMPDHEASAAAGAADSAPAPEAAEEETHDHNP